MCNVKSSRLGRNYLAKSVPTCFSYYMSLDDKLELLKVWSIRSKEEFWAECQLAEFIQTLSYQTYQADNHRGRMWIRAGSLSSQVSHWTTQKYKLQNLLQQPDFSTDWISWTSLNSYMRSSGLEKNILIFFSNVITWVLEHSLSCLCWCCLGNGGMNSVRENPAVKQEGTAPAMQGAEQALTAWDTFYQPPPPHSTGEAFNLLRFENISCWQRL